MPSVEMHFVESEILNSFKTNGKSLSRAPEFLETWHVNFIQSSFAPNLTFKLLSYSCFSQLRGLFPDRKTHQRRTPLLNRQISILRSKESHLSSAARARCGSRASLIPTLPRTMIAQTKPSIEQPGFASAFTKACSSFHPGHYDKVSRACLALAHTNV